MITAEVEGTIPAISQLDFEEGLTDCGRLMLDHIRQTFGKGGDPKWAPLKSGGPSFLFQSGALLQSNNVYVGPNYVEAGQFGGPVYQWIHQYGGTINWPGTENGFGRGIHIPAHLIPMPKREYAAWTNDLIQRCIEVLTKGVYKFLNSKGEPVSAG